MSETNVRDVVLYSRVRLARNFAEIPFPAAMRGEDGANAQFRAADALAHVPQGRQYSLQRIHDLPDTRRRVLEEKHLISRELLSSGEYAAVLLRSDEDVCIMLNEEDHLRIHALLPGQAIEEAAALAFEVDDAIGSVVSYAFDSELGFLTSCLTNTGTGMRVTALLHLPALTRAGALGAMAEEVGKLSHSLRPLYSEDGAAIGELYLLGNQRSLGRSERELLDSIEAIVGQVVDRERSAREILLMEDPLSMEDQLMRSLGALRYARRLSEAEWMRRWSDVRLAIQAGMLSMPLHALDALLNLAKPAHLEQGAGRELSPLERDEARAALVRGALGA
ncbi:MAG: ATP--guanido phosphotransferase [Firmicutes bacterium]|nr:ATP--guanido phosphotransferase [Bacillota bacterium]